MSIAETLIWQGIGALIGALAIGWRPWERKVPPVYYAPLDPTPPTMTEVQQP